MEGFLISYEPNLQRNDITDINYFLFGKVLSKKSKKYYYPGLLDDTEYLRLGNGCYFIRTTNTNIINLLQQYNNIIVYSVSIDIDNTVLKTAKAIKRIKYDGVFVKNL